MTHLMGLLNDIVDNCKSNKMLLFTGVLHKLLVKTEMYFKMYYINILKI